MGKYLSLKSKMRLYGKRERAQMNLQWKTAKGRKISGMLGLDKAHQAKIKRIDSKT
jgi:hypothetical protein